MVLQVFVHKLLDATPQFRIGDIGPMYHLLDNCGSDLGFQPAGNPRAIRGSCKLHAPLPLKPVEIQIYASQHNGCSHFCNGTAQQFHAVLKIFVALFERPLDIVHCGGGRRYGRLHACYFIRQLLYQLVDVCRKCGQDNEYDKRGRLDPGSYALRPAAAALFGRQPLYQPLGPASEAVNPIEVIDGLRCP